MKQYGLIGRRLDHSRSPEIHRHFFDHYGIEGCYGLFEIEPTNLAELPHALALLGVAGANVTIPYKEAIIPFLDRLSPTAQAIGAVNTLVCSGGKWVGDNTDAYGFSALLKHHGIEVEAQRVCLLGSGGASKAIEVALMEAGVGELILVTRQAEETRRKYEAAASEKPWLAQALAQDRLQIWSYETLETRKTPFRLLINATPVGMGSLSGQSPVGEGVLAGCEAVVDTIYNPRETRLMAQARSLGIPTAGGLYMLVAQAIASQGLWQAMEADPRWIDQLHQRLLRGDSAKDRPIFLIGLPGSGKSTLGKALAQALGWSFEDMDNYVEQLSGSTIPALFEQGEAYFRDWESQACLELAQRRKTVVACGGGVVLRQKNVQVMVDQGRILWIDRPLEAIRQDIDRSTRPLLQKDSEALTRLDQERRALYAEAAAMRIPNEGTQGRVLTEILEALAH